MNHENKIKALSKATFEHTDHAKDGFTDFFKEQSQISFEKTNRNWLTLTFDQGQQGKRKDFKRLQLTFLY